MPMAPSWSTPPTSCATVQHTKYSKCLSSVSIKLQDGTLGALGPVCEQFQLPVQGWHSLAAAAHHHCGPDSGGLQLHSCDT
jgi:hypothetical protein